MNSSHKSDRETTREESAPGNQSDHWKYDRFKESGQTTTENKTTLGWCIFNDGIYGARPLIDIRNQIEVKLAACLAMGGTNGFPISPDRIRNPFFRQIVSAGMSAKGWNVKDLAGCVGRLAIPTETVLIATLEEPVWGEDDAVLFRLLESIEGLEVKSTNGGRTL